MKFLHALSSVSFTVILATTVVAADIDLSMLTPEQAEMYKQYEDKADKFTPKNDVYGEKDDDGKIINNIPSDGSEAGLSDDEKKAALLKEKTPDNPFMGNKGEGITLEMYDAIQKEVEYEAKKYKNPFIYVTNKEAWETLQKNQVNPREKELTRYSEKFFLNENALISDAIPVPSYYILVPGDTISIVLYGSKNKEYTLTIDRNGNIVVPDLGSIKIASLEYDHASKLITKRLKKAFSNTSVLLDIVQFSAIQVMITGDVKYPGLYNLSSFSSIENALVASKGVAASGTVRDVTVKRKGKVITHFDMYDLLKFAKNSHSTLLRNGDVIHIGKAKKLITLKGAVVEAGIYEVKKGETFKTALLFASGVKFSANEKQVRLTRYNKGSAEVKTLTLEELKKLTPLNGDFVEFFVLNDEDIKKVSIFGNVATQGAGELNKKTTLNALLERESTLLLKDTHYETALIKHKSKNGVEEVEEVNLQDVLNNKITVKLNNLDEIYIFNRFEIKENPYIKVQGVVVAQQNKYQYYKGMTLSNLFNVVLFSSESNITEQTTQNTIITQDKKNLVLEKNKDIATQYENDERELTEVIQNVKVDRYNIQLNRLTSTGLQQYHLDLNKDASMKLLPFDEVTFFDYYDSHAKMSIHLYGELFRADTYALKKDMTILQAIRLAGGLTKKAYKNRVEIVRYTLNEGKRERSVLEIDLTQNQDDFRLQEDDEIYIRSIPSWRESDFVTIEGEVQFPGRYQIGENEKLSDVIKRAGGFLETAFLPGAVFTRVKVQKLQEDEMKRSLDEVALKMSLLATADNPGSLPLIRYIEGLTAKAQTILPIGRVTVQLDASMEKFSKSYFNVMLHNEDKLVIPKKREAIILSGEVLSPNAVVFEKGNTVSDYIEKVGGYKLGADKDNIFIIKADGSYKRYKNGFFWDSNDAIEYGDVIVVMKKIIMKSNTSMTSDIVDIGYKLAISVASLNTLGLF